MTDNENQYAVLPFSNGQDYWAIAESGDWSADNRTGRQAAADLLRVMTFQDAPHLLGFVVKAMMTKGRFGGVEAGFCQAIAEAAVE
ncbi:MAG: hypothetical protein ACI9YM_001936 [Brevundimonas sp.]|jgi:hypothetical protein|uniref:hypothetical protein n=1 Tax=Brevundimonas sp. TaxID=1871086 RepID=UPI0039E3A4AD